VVANALDVVTQVLNPKMKQFRENTLRLLWEGSNKVATCKASAVSYWPRGIFETIKKSAQELRNVRLKWFLINCCSDFCAELGDAMA
jgi:ectoine hydroxylase-related dioxygenase (phytanoyl-CoA dioxygenase family)